MTVPNLEIGTVISGFEVIAAVRQPDKAGYMPGLHVVTAWNESRSEMVTWQVAWQESSTPYVSGRWVANSGHYFPADGLTPGSVRPALEDMLKRV
jgi:hypothetical protein